MAMAMDRRWRANIDPAPNCPRCASSNTKFCYYNNYSLSQPRFFCKGCRRYWTRGGSLRNVPVGGGCRKSRRARSSKTVLARSSIPSDPSDNLCSDSSGESLEPEIDLAAVFSKFLNHDQSNANEDINDTTNTSSEASHDSLNSINGFESQKLLDDQEFRVIEEDAIKGFMNPDSVSFDEIIEDVFLSDASNNPSTFQEFDYPLFPIDQFKISTNTFSCNDNWSNFDTTTFEVFSRP